MSRHIPADLPALLQMPVRILLQAEVYAAAGARVDRARTIDAAHKRGVARARRG